MTLKKDKIVFARSLIHEADDSFYHAGSFVDLQFRICFGTSSNKALSIPCNLSDYIRQDIWNLETLIFRLNWQKELFSGNQLDKSLWMEFAACDIDLFHVQLRSTFDYLAKLTMCFADKPGQVGDQMSFRELQQWLRKKPDHPNKLGVDLATLVLDCDWFGSLRDIRDSIVHKGGKVMVFPEKGRILFQVHEGFKNKIHIKEIMYNENVVDFELYGAILIGNLFHYLEDVANVLHTKLNNVGVLDIHPRNYHSGLGVIRNWFDRVCSITES
jgi:hypothetical protein